MKLIDFINAQNILFALNNTEGLNAVTAYRIGKNIKIITDELKVYEEQRIKIVKELAEKDKNGNAISKSDDKGNIEYVLNDENKIKLAEQLKSIMNEDVSANIKKVKIEDLNPANLTPLKLMLLDFMIDAE